MERQVAEIVAMNLGTGCENSVAQLSYPEQRSEEA